MIARIMHAIVRATFALLPAFLLFAPAAAQTQSTLGLGSLSCGQFIKAARSSDMLYHQAASWLLGYVSGLSAARGAAITVTSDQLMKSAGDYCEANPASTIAQAAVEWQGSQPRAAGEQQQPQPQQSGRSWTIDLNKPSGYRFEKR